MSAKTDRQENKVIEPCQSALVDSNDYTRDRVDQKQFLLNEFHMGTYNLWSLTKGLNPRKRSVFSKYILIENLKKHMEHTGICLNTLIDFNFSYEI